MSLYQTTNIQYDKKRQGIYTDLDTLYDTRIAAIEEVDTKLALFTLASGWHSRVEDKVPPLSDEVYNELYDSRDVKTLTLASPTFVTEAIRAWVAHAITSMNGTPFAGYVELFVNVWPYKLTREEAREYATKLTETLANQAKVTMLNIDPKSITALDAKMYFSVMFINDWYVWLEERAKQGDIKTTPLPNVALHAPKVCRGAISHGEYELIKDVDIFSTVQDRLQPIIGLEFLETSFFSSAITPEAAIILLNDLQTKEQEAKEN